MNRSTAARSHAGEHTTAGPPPGGQQTGGGRLNSVLRHDLPASLVVFLIAIPLSLGIAAATGAPLIAGLVAAVVGGILAGALSGAPLQVSGPAAGLTVIVAGVIADFGWAATAAITVGAGLLQILLAVTRVGRLALSLSPSVVHGMLAGIGITIAAGQFNVMLGGASASSVLANLAAIPGNLISLHSGSLLIGAATVAILLAWPRIPRAKVVPAPLVAVVAATALGSLFGPDLARVDLPEDPIGDIVLPQLPQGGMVSIAVAIVTVALVASVESVLSAVAVDKLHNGPRANLDRELVAQGVGNTVSGALGGLPITGVIVRSSTNVAAGARSRASTMLHGLWILVFVLLLGGVLELIPMAALAGVLFVTGVRLVNGGHMRQLLRHGEFASYVVTVLGVVTLGLVEGVLLGIGVTVLGALVKLTDSSVRVDRDEDDHADWRVVVRGSLAFLRVGRLVRELRQIPLGQHVVLELHVDFMDHAAFEAVDDWRSGYERLGGRVDVDEVHDSWYSRAVADRLGRRKTPPSPLPRWFAPWSHWQAQHTAPRTPAAMLRGMDEFQRRAAPLVRPFLEELAAQGQRPGQLFLTCADSRVVPNMITSSGPGDLFCVRNIGNLVPRYDAAGPEGDASVGAAIEFAVDVLEVPTIVVCGHSDCGAMKAVLAGSSEPESRLGSWLRHAAPSLDRFRGRTDAHDHTDLPDVERLSVANVLQQLENLHSYPSVRRAVERGELKLVGMYFDISAARVYLVDAERGELSPVRVPASTATPATATPATGSPGNGTSVNGMVTAG
ncbi:SulP family inorganic anion transporter [Goodfellowiella coeruleoviolacea]|uniref:carbonic anhydrase n=1 Tax=Goodfellowiella coeruleoviolacea TaxID=334858 RepID=A0AAE3GDS8_9PSEU|nr:SulP family inorganic anion transporter [Goodfellowiella coeruleoviolacea]MCP2166366.1 carbonic anhydrase [Goodfellowiella coeruleoviolacea]